MIGRVLYARFERAMIRQNVEIDDWAALETADQKAWDEIASKVEDKKCQEHGMPLEHCTGAHASATG